MVELIDTLTGFLLVLSVPREFPFRPDLVVLVFGVALIGIGGQGLLFPVVLRLTKATD